MNTKEQFEEWTGTKFDNLEYYNGEIPKGRQIICLDDNNIFESANQAANYYNTCHSRIIKCCNRQNRHTKDKHFLWLDDYEKMNDNELHDFWEWVDSNGSSKRVVLINTGEIFKSISEAVRTYPKSNVTKVGQCCNGTARYSGTDDNGNSLQWCYYDDYISGKYSYDPNMKLSQNQYI